MFSSKLFNFFLLFFLVFTCLLATRFVADAVPMPVVLKLNLKPEYGADGNAVSIAVSYEVPFADENKEHGLTLQFDKLEPFLQRGKDQVTGLRVTDGNGSVTFDSPIEKQEHDRNVQLWHASRPVVGAVQVAYQVPVAEPLPMKRGPHVELQAAGGGLAGTFGSFLLLPYFDKHFKAQLDWRLPAGSSAVCTFGTGNCTAKTDYDQLMNCQFLAGPLYSYPKKPSEKGFSIYGLGRTAAEMKGAAAWPQKAYEQLRLRFHGLPDKAFRFFFRAYNGGPLMSGVATNGSFMVYLPPGLSASDAELHSLIAHEMVHVWVPGLTAPESREDWYDEGIADYLSVLIPYQAGLYSKEEYLKLINQECALYYTNAYRLTPDKDIPSMKWSGRNAWSLPYSRGMLYFADLDAKLRRLKGNKVSVLSLINTINQWKAEGKEVTARTWTELLRRQAGAWAVKDWNAMENGQLLFPVADAFGPGLVCRKVKVGLFDLGFDQPKNIRAGQHIKGLVKGSAAEKAGLREDDEIAETINLNPCYSSYTLPVTITVRRGQQLVPVTFQPHRGGVDGLEWVELRN